MKNFILGVSLATNIYLYTLAVAMSKVREEKRENKRGGKNDGTKVN